MYNYKVNISAYKSISSHISASTTNHPIYILICKFTYQIKRLSKRREISRKSLKRAVHIMALLRQHARPMCTRHFKGSSLFEEEILALNPSLFPIHGKSSEILFEHQAEVDSCVVGVGGTKKRGGVNKHPFNCQRQRRYFLKMLQQIGKSYG